MSDKIWGDNRFHVIKLLGSGSNGEVYHVLDLKNDNKSIAIKMLETTDVLETHARERFLKEILILSSIDHKNIVSAYEVIKFKGKDAYTMEFVDGCNLSDYLDKLDPSKDNTKEIDSIMTQLLFAVAELHRRNIIHRDIKLENILLRKDGIVKISDFGLVKILDERARTDPGLILGTCHYLSPEYILNKKIDHRIDIYACGMVLWELTHARRRFDDLNHENVLGQLIREGFKHPEVSADGPYAKYRPILKKALAEKPEHRYKSADEMRREFTKRPRSINFHFSNKPDLKHIILTLALIVAISALLYTF